MIVQQGSINTMALLVPDLYVQIVPPQVTFLNGVPTNVLGVVGTAQWGPVNSPTIIGSMADYARNFGAIQNRKYDAGTQVAAAVLQGANNFRVVRVTDGTEAAGTANLMDTAGTPAIGATLTAFYTGTLGNSIVASIVAGSAANTFKLTIALPNQVPEVFDNIGGSAGVFWTNLVAAVNNGNAARGPSQLVTAAAGVGTAAPNVTNTYTLSGGTDGATTITGSTLIGQDTVPRKGMYALRGTSASIAVLADDDDSTTWTNQVSYGLSEGTYMIMVGPAGQSVAAAVTAKNTAGIDSYAAKLLLGDWVYFNDTVNNVRRLISPQGYAAGRLANLSPEQSSLNKQLFGIVGTQKSALNQVYSSAELQTLAGAGIDLIANPSPGGNYFAVRIGHNTSSNAVINGDNYTRMTNYIAATLNAGMGIYIGQLQSPDERQRARTTIQTFLQNLQDQGLIGDVNAPGKPAYSVVLDATNNPISRVALGYQQADVKVVYLSIVEKFIINVEGGQSVQINRQTSLAAAA